MNHRDPGNSCESGDFGEYVFFYSLGNQGILMDLVTLAKKINMVILVILVYLVILVNLIILVMWCFL